jgi:hypothetical protein
MDVLLPAPCALCRASGSAAMSFLRFASTLSMTAIDSAAGAFRHE